MEFSWFFGWHASSNVDQYLHSIPRMLHMWMTIVEEYITLEKVKQQSRESLANFYGRFHKNVSDINCNITDGEVFWAFYRGLELKNKEYRKLWKNYHVAEIETLKQLTIRAKGFINLERDDTEIK